jgi:hypothetical protein
LTRCADAALRDLAQRDLQGMSVDATEQLALAVAWRQYAASLEYPLQYGSLARAQYWCEHVDAAPLSGIDRANLERISGEIDRDIDGLRAKCRLIAGTTDTASRDEVAAVELSGDLTELFHRGLAAALQERDFDLAERIFRQCIALDEDNVASLNNCALASMRGGNFRRGLHLWLTATKLQADCEAIAHNAMLLSRLADTGNVALDASMRKDLSDLCSQIQGSPRSRTRGFLYMPLDGTSSPMASLVDDACIYCNGLGRVECPVRGCSRGTVGSTATEVVGRNPVNGQVIVKNRPIRVPCGTCGGRGQVDCRHCSRGTMPAY